MPCKKIYNFFKKSKLARIWLLFYFFKTFFLNISFSLYGSVLIKNLKDL
jgi:hypothetical protein